MTNIPVITIDGPGGTGKGTVSKMLAEHLGWHFLDSGVLYRALGLAAVARAIPITDSAALARLALALDIKFSHAPGGEVLIALDGSDVTEAIRSEHAANTASAIGALPEVRTALLARQRAFAQLPGLVTDGRDMGTVVFPQALLKIYLDATPAERARRRYAQLQKHGEHFTLAAIEAELAERDERDRNRSTAPLQPAADAIIIDTTSLDIAAVLAQVLDLVRERVQSDS